MAEESGLMDEAFDFVLPQDPYGELNKFATTKEVTDGTCNLTLKKK